MGLGLGRMGSKLIGLITRAVVDRSGDTQNGDVQVLRYGKASTVEQFQPQGLYFRAPPGAEGVIVNTGGSASSAVMLGAQDRETWPAGGGIEDGTGGLHYLGNWKVFLDEDGNLHLGTDSGESLISRDDKIQAELARIKGDIQALVNAWGGVPGAADGGAALQTFAQAALTAVPSDPGDTAAENVKTT